MVESLFYNNHHIVISTSEQVFGSWQWSYLIDGEGPYASQGHPVASRAQALKNALRSAKARIDRSRTLTHPRTN
jgi:hypothetical protein